VLFVTLATVAMFAVIRAVRKIEFWPKFVIASYINIELRLTRWTIANQAGDENTEPNHPLNWNILLTEATKQNI